MAKDIQPQAVLYKMRKIPSEDAAWIIGQFETFEKCSVLFKFKEGENFNQRNTFSISRIKI